MAGKPGGNKPRGGPKIGTAKSGGVPRKTGGGGKANKPANKPKPKY